MQDGPAGKVAPRAADTASAPSAAVDDRNAAKDGPPPWNAAPTTVFSSVAIRQMGADFRVN